MHDHLRKFVDGQARALNLEATSSMAKFELFEYQVRNERFFTQFLTQLNVFIETIKNPIKEQGQLFKIKTTNAINTDKVEEIMALTDALGDKVSRELSSHQPLIARILQRENIWSRSKNFFNKDVDEPARLTTFEQKRPNIEWNNKDGKLAPHQLDIQNFDAPLQSIKDDNEIKQAFTRKRQAKAEEK